MVNVVDAIGEEFEVDTLSVKQKVLAGFATGTPHSGIINSFMESANPVIDDAVEAGRYELALTLAQTAYRLSLQPQGTTHRRNAHQRQQEVQRLVESWRKVKAAHDTLKTNPDDPDANLAVGRWFCFEQGNWQKGLPHLAKCSNPAVKGPAAEELKEPKTSDAQVELADTWWALAEQSNGSEKNVLMLHAAEWYGKASPRLPAGLGKAKAEKRLAEAAKIK